MLTARTKLQKDADKIDMQIFNLICRLEEMPSKEFAKAITNLRLARVIVRRQMHEADRDATI